MFITDSSKLLVRRRGAAHSGRQTVHTDIWKNRSRGSENYMLQTDTQSNMAMLKVYIV